MHHELYMRSIKALIKNQMTEGKDEFLIQHCLELLLGRLLSLEGSLPDPIKSSISRMSTSMPTKLPSLSQASIITFCDGIQRKVETIFKNSMPFNQDSHVDISGEIMLEMHHILVDLSNFYDILHHQGVPSADLVSEESTKQLQSEPISHFLIRHQFSSLYALLLQVFDTIPLERMKETLMHDHYIFFHAQVCSLTLDDFFRNFLSSHTVGSGKSSLFKNISTHPYKSDFTKLAHMLLFLAASDSSIHTCFSKVCEILMSFSEFSSMNSIMGIGFRIEIDMPLLYNQLAIIDAWKNLPKDSDAVGGKSDESIDGIDSSVQRIMAKINNFLQERFNSLNDHQKLKSAEILSQAKLLLESISAFRKISNTPDRFSANPTHLTDIEEEEEDALSQAESPRAH